MSPSEAQNIADRSALRALWKMFPHLSNAEYARRLGRSESWARDWIGRFRAAPTDTTVIFGRSHARKHPPPPIAPEVIAEILDIRDHPPDGLRRIPGPKAILYYLPKRFPERPPQALPRSTRTTWRILCQHDRITRAKEDRPKALYERPVPLEWWQIDFKDSRFVPGDPDGKQQHAVEIFDILDYGSDLSLLCDPATNYTAETIFTPIIATLQRYGLPNGVTFDNDPRYVGSPTGRDFPSAFVRFWYCLGVMPDISPPHYPQHNGAVERFHRTLDSECLCVDVPTTLEATREATERFQWHYNTERPNQSIVCGNRPPAVAYPVLPERPTLPKMIDPDRWLRNVDGIHFARKVKANGSVELDSRGYYISRGLAGQAVTLQVEAETASLLVWHQKAVEKRLPIKGLTHHEMPWDEYAAMIAADARSQWQEYLRKERAKTMRKQAS